MRVGKRIQNKLFKIDDELADLGVHIEFHQRRAKFKSARGFGAAMRYAADIWLVYSVTKEAIGRWPAIRQLLVSAGMKRDEIITLGLSTMTKANPKKKSARKRSGSPR